MHSGNRRFEWIAFSLSFELWLLCGAVRCCACCAVLLSAVRLRSHQFEPDLHHQIGLPRRRQPVCDDATVKIRASKERQRERERRCGTGRGHCVRGLQRAPAQSAQSGPASACVHEELFRTTKRTARPSASRPIVGRGEAESAIRAFMPAEGPPRTCIQKVEFLNIEIVRVRVVTFKAGPRRGCTRVATFFEARAERGVRRRHPQRSLALAQRREKAAPSDPTQCSPCTLRRPHEPLLVTSSPHLLVPRLHIIHLQRIERARSHRLVGRAPGFDCRKRSLAFTLAFTLAHASIHDPLLPLALVPQTNTLR